MKININPGKIFLALFLGVGLFVIPTSGLATHTPESRRLAEEARKARELAEQKKREAAELQAVVNKLNSQIRQVQSQIRNTQVQISRTESEIADLTDLIRVKEEELAHEEENQNEAIRVLYETSGQSTLEVLVGSDSISSLVSHSEYLEALEVRIEATIAEIERLKAELEQKRTDLEARRSELVALERQLQLQRSFLQDQESQKARLLANTKIELANFRATESEALSALNRIEAQLQVALSRICRDGVKGGGPRVGERVSSGSIVGYEGSSGYSTGPHVHFEVCASGKAVNPIGYVPPLRWPLSEGFRITQAFGMTEYAQGGAYGGSPHTGIDMTVTYGAPVYAGGEGEVVLDQYYGGYGNAVIVDHGNGLYTLYGHMID